MYARIVWTTAIKFDYHVEGLLKESGIKVKVR